MGEGGCDVERASGVSRYVVECERYDGRVAYALVRGDEIERDRARSNDSVSGRCRGVDEER